MHLSNLEYQHSTLSRYPDKYQSLFSSPSSSSSSPPPPLLLLLPPLYNLPPLLSSLSVNLILRSIILQKTWNKELISIIHAINELKSLEKCNLSKKTVVR